MNCVYSGYMDKFDDLESAVRALVEEYEEAVEEARACKSLGGIRA